MLSFAMNKDFLWLYFLMVLLRAELPTQLSAQTYRLMDLLSRRLNTGTLYFFTQ
jgi:hypothetical protein